MSHFGAKLEELLEKNKLTAAELSRSSRVNDALISRWINGTQDFVSHEALESLTLAISKKPTEQAELIKAHLLDECVGEGSNLIEINILGQPDQLAETTIPYRIVPSLKIQRALELMARESITDADVRNLILSTGDLLARFNSKTGVDLTKVDQLDAQMMQGDVQAARTGAAATAAETAAATPVVPHPSTGSSPE